MWFLQPCRSPKRAYSSDMRMSSKEELETVHDREGNFLACLKCVLELELELPERFLALVDHHVVRASGFLIDEIVAQGDAAEDLAGPRGRMNLDRRPLRNAHY